MDTLASMPGGDGGPKLVFRSGPLRGNVVALEKDRVSLGRDPRNEIAIHDDIISSFHAAVIREHDGHWLEDLDSKNGTFLNGERVQRARLNDGDLFCLCQTGPEVQFTVKRPSLPTIMESTTATFGRTGSLTQAFREILPGRRGGGAALLSLTGVRKILDYKLEESTRRSRLLFLGLSGLFLTLSAVALAAVVLLRGGHEAGMGSGEVSRAGTSGGSTAAGGSSQPTARLDPKLEPIYGSLFLSYRESPIGEVEVTNLTGSVLSGCELVFRFENAAARFLVEPYQVAVPEVGPGGVARVPIKPKLSTEVLSSQTREVTAAVLLTRDGQLLDQASRAVFVHSRNVFNWERPERIAVFIDPNDPAVREIVQRVWEARPLTNREEFPPPAVVGALTLLTGLANLGLRYLPDGTNPISERIDARANERVNYPGETLLGRSGDCDDLAVLCCAVLEAARIPTAFVVEPGHVYMLFDTGIKAESLAESPLEPETVVTWRGRIWLPIESTSLAQTGSGFATAWSAAWPRCARAAAGEARIIELKEAWREFNPMNPPVDEATRVEIAAMSRRVAAGLDDRVQAGFESVKHLFRDNLSRRIDEAARVHAEGPARDQAIGLLYAKSGLFTEARRVLEKAIFGNVAPASLPDLREWGKRIGDDTAILLSDLVVCLTLGAHSARDLDTAATYGELAVGGFPDDPGSAKGEMMLRVALVHRLRGDLSSEKSWCARAFQLDPGLRATYGRLVAAGGPVAGPSEEIARFLRDGLK